jgi:hypothetical protein
MSKLYIVVKFDFSYEGQGFYGLNNLYGHIYSLVIFYI